MEADTHSGEIDESKRCVFDGSNEEKGVLSLWGYEGMSIFSDTMY